MGQTNRKRIILMSSRAQDGPSPALLEAAREADVIIHENNSHGHSETDQISWETGGAHASLSELTEMAEINAPIFAVLYEIAHEVSTDELRQAVAHVSSTWAGVPVIAYHPYDTQRREGMNRHDHQTSLRLLKYLGFRAVIDEAHQLSQTLLDLEEQGTSRGTTDPAFAPAETERGEALLGLAQLPPTLGAKQLRTALEIVTALHFASDQQQAAQAALAGLARLVHADTWAIYRSLGEEQNDQLGLLSAIGRAPDEQAKDSLRRHDAARHSRGNRAALGLAKLPESEQVSALTQEAIKKTETLRRTHAGKHVVVVPLVYGDRVYGVVEAERVSPTSRAFKKSETELLEALAVPLACALANAERIAKAEHLSLTDDLTKLNNARYLRQFLTSEIKRARRYNAPVAVIFLDLDDFKRVNDVHGHLTGSHILAELATVVLRSVRDTDVVTRYGGDEFVVVLPQSKAEQAVFVAERMREKIATRTFTGGRGLRLRVTASFGVAAFPQNALSPQQLIGCADAAMYQAKAATKNCVRLALDVSKDILEKNAYPA